MTAGFDAAFDYSSIGEASEILGTPNGQSAPTDIWPRHDLRTDMSLGNGRRTEWMAAPRG